MRRRRDASRRPGPRNRRWLRLGLWAAPLVLSWAGVRPLAAQEPAVPGAEARPERPRPALPFKEAVRQPLVFPGPGRDDPEPEVSEVVVGWFGPNDPSHPDFGELWRGATLAIGEENAAGGYHDKPFRLVASWSESPWQAGVVGVTRLVFKQRVWAVIGGVDGATTHLAEQVALKSFFLLLSPGNTDVTADHANVPWLFSLPPSDEAQAPVVADALAEAAAGGPFVIAVATDHDSHAALRAMRRALTARRLVYSGLVEFTPARDDAAAVSLRLLESHPRAVLVLAPPVAAGRLVAALRGSGFGGVVLGGATLATNAFRRVAGRAVEDVRAPMPTASGPGWQPFADSYQRTWGEAPDQVAARGYDAVRLVAAAVRAAGLNRARIRDAVRGLAPWEGSSGVVRWNALGRNQAALTIGTWKGTRLVPVLSSLPRQARMVKR